MKNLNSLTPPTPASFHDRIITTIDKLDETKTAKRAKLSAVPIAALISLMLLASLAYAAQTGGLLDRLFGNRAPTPEAQALLSVSGETSIQNGVTLTLNEYLLEGVKLHLRATAVSSNDEPLLCTMNFPSIEGYEVLGGMFTNGGVGQFIMLEKGVPAEFMMSVTLNAAPEPNAAYTLSLSALAIRTFKPAETYAVIGKRGEIVYYDVSSEDSAYLRAQAPERALGDVLAQAGLAETVADLNISVSAVVKPSERAKHIARTYEFTDYTLEILNMDFGETALNIEFHIYPKRALDTDASGGKITDPLYARRYKLLDAQGNDITKGVEGGWESGIMLSGEEAEGDPAHICWLGDWGPVSVPDSVTLLPYALSDGAETPIFEEAVLIY